MFNRDADAEGLAFYTDLLDSGAASLASIALDIANGATGDDVTILNNKIEVANHFTADVEDSSALYQASDIAGAQGVLAIVDETEASVTAGKAASDAFVETMPTELPGGEYTLDEDNSTADFQAATGAVTVILDGDSDEAAFDVNLSTFDDTLVLEEYGSADITDSGGIDTLDTSEHSGFATVSLLAGTFSMTDGADVFKGTIAGVENVVGTDEDDTITGSSGDNEIWSGEGDDTVRGGLGDDTFYYEDETELGIGTVDGQTGEDTVVLSADGVDLTAVVDGDFVVEHLVLSNTDLEDEVGLALSPIADGHVGIDDLDSITGSAAVDTITVLGDIDLTAIELNSIEVLVAATVAAEFTIAPTTAGLALVNGVDTDGVLNLSSPLASATFNVAANSLTGISDLVGQTGIAGVYETVQINQGIIDTLIANGAGSSVDTFQDLSDIAATGSDVALLTSNVDFTVFTADADIDLATVAFGSGVNTVVFGSFAATGITAVVGGLGTSDVLVSTPGADQDLTLNAITDVESIIFDVDSADFGKFDVTLSETSLTGVSLLNGEVNIIADVSAAGEAAGATVDLTGVAVTEGVDVSSLAAADVITLSQEGIDGFSSLGADSGLISLAVADGAMDLGSAKIAAAAALSVTGSAGDDVVVGEPAAALTPVTGRLATGTGAYALGTGDDTFTGNATTVDLAGGNNTFQGVALVSINATDGLGATSTDGNNVIAGGTYGTLTTGGGNDVAIGFFDAATTMGGGNDSLTGAGGAADLGSGDDSFTTFGATYQAAIAAAQAIGPDTTVVGGDGADTLSTTISGDSLTGGAGQDVFTISAEAFSAVYVGTSAATGVPGAAGTVNVSGAVTTVAANAVAINGLGITILDMNIGEPDVLQIDLHGTYTTGTTVTSGVQGLSGTTTLTTALAAARTAAGGVRVLNGQGNITIIDEGEALGNSVLMPVITGIGVLPAAPANGTVPPNTIDFMNFIYDTNVGGTAGGGMQAAYANTTYVMFAMAATGLAANALVAYLVTANPLNTGTVAIAEVATVGIATITGTVLSAGDVFLI